MTVKVTKPALNLREELSSLKKPSGVAGEAMLRAETPQEQFNLIGAGRKNLIINGAMQVAQRGTSGTQTSYLYMVDRWRMRGSNNTGGTVTWEQVHDGATPKLAMTFSGATGHTYITHDFEGQNIKHCYGKTVTATFKTTFSNPKFSFLVTSDGGGTEEVIVNKVTPTSLGNNMYSYTFTMTEHSTSPSISNNRGGSFYVYSDDVGTPIPDGTYYLWECQLELGSVATPFEHRSYGEELALCQRYYTQITMAAGAGYATGAGQSSRAYTTVMFPVKMRATPSSSTSNITITGTNNNGIFLSSYISKQGHAVGAYSSSSGSQFWNIVSGYIEYDAEL